MTKDKNHNHLSISKDSSNKVDYSLPAKLTAFTLAEVLITLGIIGVVAAITIPNLIAEQQKRTTVTKLQRAISVINQAYKQSFDEVGDATPEEAQSLGPENYIKTYWQPYLKIHNICRTYSDCSYPSEYPLMYASGSASLSPVIKDGVRIGIQTMDGFTYVIFTAEWKAGDSGFDSATDVIWLDLNGAEKPNKFGKDVFYLVRLQDKGVFPKCHSDSNSFVNSNCSKTGTGFCCAEKIRRAGWKIEKDYPW